MNHVDQNDERRQLARPLQAGDAGNVQQLAANMGQIAKTVRVCNPLILLK